MKNIPEFKGIPVDGKVSDFVSQLETKGFATILEDDICIVMKGEFIGQAIKAYILFTPCSRIVWKVAVYFPECRSWESLKQSYENMVELYSNKYTIEKHYEFFKDPYYEGDGYELTAFNTENAHYCTFFSDGIIVEISSDASILISYENKQNTETYTTEKKKNDLNDI